MPRLLVFCLAFLGPLIGACGGESASCDLPELWSTATSQDGSLCQVNIFTDPEYSVYCGGSTGTWDCACGPAAENPAEFVSADFCDLADEERVCEAIARCNFPL